MVTPVHTHAHACPVHTHAVLHNAPSTSTAPSFHHEMQTQEKAPRCHFRGHLRVHPCTHPTREHRAPSHQHPPGAPNRSATGRCRPSCKHLTHPSHTGCTTKHPTHAGAVLPIAQPLSPHLHPPSPLQQDLLVCAEQAHPAHPSQPLHTTFPITGRQRAVTRVGGVCRARRTDVLLCCAQLLLMREKPQGWPYSWARLPAPATTQQNWECQAEMCQGGTGAGCEALVCKRLGQAGLAGQVQACAAGARQQHV